jgi:hypothetical protein
MSEKNKLFGYEISDEDWEKIIELEKQGEINGRNI